VSTATPEFDRFFAFRRFGGALQFAPDGDHVYFVSDISGQFNLWRVAVAGGWPSQLTGFEDRTVRSIAVSRPGGKIAFTADANGDEFHQVFLLDAEGGWPQQVTDEPQVQHHIFPGAFSTDGTRLAYSANARTPSDMEVFVRDLDTGESRPLFGEGRATLTFAASWSPDGRSLLVAEFRALSNIVVYLVNVADGTALAVTDPAAESTNVPGPWRPDGSGFYFLSDEGREFSGIAFHDVAAGRHDWIETPDRDVEDVALSADGELLCWLVNEDGYERIAGRRLASGQQVTFPGLPAGARRPGAGDYPPLAVSADGGRVACVLSTPRRPPELYVLEGGEARQASESWIGGGIAEDALVDADLVHYGSFDGREIPAWLYRPAAAEGPAPVVLCIHGGPHAQEKPVYSGLYQYLLSRGIGVLATNIRGSTGYGKTYTRLVDRDWGGGDLQDWEHAAGWLREQTWVDPDRIGIFGASYGGFAVLSCVTRLPDYWSVAVDIVGPANLITFAKSVPPTWKAFIREMLGDPDEDADFLRERSPLTYIENATAPLLVIQGAKDPRVVRGESDQLVERLRALGRTIDYVVFDDEGHGFTRRENEHRAFRLAAEWLERHLTN
jgi:dipeptidyl aminopeptidase/acylaminoacyl peptidase